MTQDTQADVRALEKAYRRCEQRLGRPATNIEVSEELGITVQSLHQQLRHCRNLGIGRFEEIKTNELPESGLVRYVPFEADEDQCYIYDKSEFRRSLSEAINDLPKNERLVVLLHYGQKKSLAEVAASFGFPEARIAEIHTTAMMRIRPKLLELPDKAPQHVFSCGHYPSSRQAQREESGTY